MIAARPVSLWYSDTKERIQATVCADVSP